MSQTENNRRQVLYALFVGLIIAMNLLGVKVINIFGVTLSVGIFMLPITFLITDIVAEVYGRSEVQRFIIGGLITLILVMGYTLLFVNLEPADRFAESDIAYRTIFGNSLRMITASIVAFFLSQTHDLIAFEFWKKKTKGKALWLRNNLSTIVSQMIDSFAFMFIAFYNVTPKFTFAFIVSMSIPFYLFKVLFALLDTPFVYLGVMWLKKERPKTAQTVQS